MLKIARAASIASILVCGFFANFSTADAGYNFWKWLNFGSDRDSTDFTVSITNKDPNAPTLVSPADEAHTNDTTPELSVNYSDDDAGDTGTTNYRIALSTFGCSENTAVVASGTSAATSTNSEATTWSPDSSIGADGTYFWCAQNNDGSATSAWTTGDGDGWSFILDTDEPVILSSSLASDNSSVTINFSSAVYTNADGSGDLTAADFTLVFTQNEGNATDTSIASVDHTAGGTSAVVNLTITGSPSGVETIEITPADGSSIFDVAGNPVAATQTTVSHILNDQVAPTIVDITSDTADGTYPVATVIDLNVTFSEAVTSTGNVTLTLETGTLDRQCYFSISNSDFATCYYTVQAGDVSPDLEVSEVSGTIADAAGNAMTDFAPTTNLAANKDIVIDGTTPNIVEIDAGASSVDRVSLTSETWFKASDAGDDDQISFSWTDPSSLSDDTFYYELNSDSGNTINGTESSTTDNFIDSIAITEGTNYFHVRPKNGATTWGIEQTFTVMYDKTDPTTSAEVTAGTLGDNSWYTTNATITITPADALSGVASTVYCIDQANTCTPTTSYTVIFEVSTEAVNYVRYFSTDNAGNIQATQSLTVKVDKTAPAGGSVVHTDGYETDTTIAVTVDRGTDSTSGMSTTDSDYFLEYRSATLTAGNCGSYGSWLDSGAAETATATNYDFTSTTGNCYQFRYTVEDEAGNSTTYTSDDTTKVDTTTPDIVAIDAGASSADRVSLTSGTWFKASDIGDDDLASFSWTDSNSPSDDTFYYDYADEGLVGWWQMDESLWDGTADEVVDSSGSGNHGVRVGDATTTSSGKIASGGTFDGTGDYVDVGNVLNFERDEAFSIFAWIKTTDTRGAIVVKANGDYPFTGYHIYIIDSALTVQLIHDWGASPKEHIERTVTENVYDGVWHQVGFTYNGSITAAGVEIYVDGLRREETTVFDNLVDTMITTAHLNVGIRDNGGKYPFPIDGLIDEVKIWNRALSADEIAAEYAKRDGVATPYADLIALIEGDGNFHVRPQNGAGTWGTERSFNAKYDKTDPMVQTDTLISPNGGESWTGGGGAAYDITWTAADFTDSISGFSATPITLEYSINSGVDWTEIATDEANDGIYSWTTPAISDSEVRIRVTATDLAGNTASDTSDADFQLSAHDDWTVLYIIDGNNQLGGMDETLPTDLKVRVGNGAGSGEIFAGADAVTVTFTLYTVPETPTAVGQALANGTFGTTFGGTSVVKTVSTDADGYASVVLTLGDRAGEYTIVGNFTGCETVEADRTFTATEREEFKVTLSDWTLDLAVSPTANTSDSAPTTLSVTTNAASYQITVDPDTWLTYGTEIIGNWAGGLGFAWDNNNSGTTGGVTDPTAFSGLDTTTVYTCSGDTCQGTNELTLDIHTAIDYTYEAGTYENEIEVEELGMSF